MPSALVFDAYGTLFDVHSVQARCEILWPGKCAQLSQLWRAKQLEYTWQRNLMRRYAPFSQVTEDALLYACEFLGLRIDNKDKQTLIWDALGAKSFGFAVYWINRTAAPVDRLGFQPDRTVKSLDEILS